MSPFDSLRKRLHAELTPRLRFGLAALFSILLFLAITSLAEDADGRALGVERMRLELNSLTGRAKDIDWNERSKEAATARQGWDQVKWRGNTAGIAAAEIQSTLTNMTKSSEVQSPRVQVSSDLVDMGGQPVLRFEASGVADSRSFFLLLGAIAANPKILLVREVSAALPGEGVGRILVAGYAPYLVSSEEQPGGVTPQLAQ